MVLVMMRRGRRRWLRRQRKRVRHGGRRPDEDGWQRGSSARGGRRVGRGTMGAVPG